jgi:hypothetical protein
MHHLVVLRDGEKDGSPPPKQYYPRILAVPSKRAVSGSREISAQLSAFMNSCQRR